MCRETIELRIGICTHADGVNLMLQLELLETLARRRVIDEYETARRLVSELLALIGGQVDSVGRPVIGYDVPATRSPLGGLLFIGKRLEAVELRLGTRQVYLVDGSVIGRPHQALGLR